MDVLETPRPSAAPSDRLRRGSSRRTRLADRLAARVITLGGAAVIVAVLAIFLFIGKEALPLFRPAHASPSLSLPLPAPTRFALPGLVGLDEYETFAYWLQPTGGLQLVRLSDWQPLPPLSGRKLARLKLTAAYRSPTHNHLYLGTADGRLLVAQLKFNATYEDSGRILTPTLEEQGLVELSPGGSPVAQVFGRHDENNTAHFAALCEDGTLYAGTLPDGEDARVEPVGGELKGPVTRLALDQDGRNLFVATADGALYWWRLEDDREKPQRTFQPRPGHHVTAMELALGDVSLLLGYDDGALEQWFGVRESADEPGQPWRRIRSFSSLAGQVTALAPASRNKGFVAAGSDGTVRLYHTTSERTLLNLSAGNPVNALCYAPKLTQVLATTSAGEARSWTIDNPHPEVSWHTLFGKVWYEGYDRPAYVWQSTGGSDDFEPKLSLAPLAFGTLKAALYGLFFAVPVAVLAAIYTSQFMSHRYRALIKPTVEIMAALPSVVIGFLAGLWLAPLLERHILSVAACFLFVPALILLGVTAWKRLPQSFRSRAPAGTELALILPLVVLAGVLASRSGTWMEDGLFGGDFRQWVYGATGHAFEQRNSIVIGFAMGFAVIPIVFTISEDALSNVPRHFVSGSLALGANRWQTATRIILPTASPGIFSAVMVGFGRAVGETMIVLMAAGNTPILSFNPFNGMRTLSANIAVEIPEAPVGGTLYRILFLTAVLLFLLTFAVNSVAEIIRHRLRQRYQAV